MRKEPAELEAVHVATMASVKGAETADTWLVQGTGRRPLWLGESERGDRGLR